MSRLARVSLVVLILLLATACGDAGDDGASGGDGGTDGSGDGDDGSGDDGTGDGDDGTGDGDDGSGDDGNGDGDDGDGTDGGGDDGAGSDEEPGSGDGQWSTVYLVRDTDGQLYVESEDRWLAEKTDAVAAAAMDQLFEHDPVDPNLMPPAGTGVEVLNVALADGLLTVDVSDAIYDAATGAAGEEAFRQALAHTGTQWDTVDEVQLLVEGEEITELWGHLDWSDPAEPDPYALAPIDVERPRYGQTLEPGRVTVSGTSLTFESTVEFELLDASGAVIEEGFTTAEQPDVDQRGPFEHTFETELEPGEYGVQVIEPDPSGGEGPPPYTAVIAFTIE